MPYDSLIFDLPLDEPNGSEVAYDFGPQQTHAKVRNCEFIPGEVGKALRNNGAGTAKTRNTNIPLQNNFSVAFWLRNRDVPGFLTPSGVKFQFEISSTDIEEYLHTEADIDQWVHWVVVKNDEGAVFYKNGQQVGTLAFLGPALTAWCYRQIVPVVAQPVFDFTFNVPFSEIEAERCTADIDEVMIFKKALSREDILRLLYPGDERLWYWIDGRKFEDYGVYVEQSTGLVDALKTKEITKVDWAGEHGVIADLERPRFLPREITLECFFKSKGYTDFVFKQNEFLSRFKTKGTHRLKVDIDRRRPLVYEVYMEDATEIKKRWRNGEFIGSFSLSLIEYLPVKRVLSWRRSAILEEVDCSECTTFSDVCPNFTLSLEGTQLVVEGTQQVLEDFELSLEDGSLYITTTAGNQERYKFEIIGNGLYRVVGGCTKVTYYGPNTVKININCKTPFTIFWGDGSVTENVLGEQVLEHTYTDNKEYFIIMAGVLEDIVSLSHNAKLAWNSL